MKDFRSYDQTPRPIMCARIHHVGRRQASVVIMTVQRDVVLPGPALLTVITVRDRHQHEMDHEWLASKYP